MTFDLSRLSKKDNIYFDSEVLEKDISFPSEGHSDAHYDLEQNSFWFIHRNKVILEAVKRFSTNNKFVEVGGGNGFVSSFLINNGYDVWFVEPSINGCINARKRGVKNVFCSFIEDLNEDSGSKSVNFGFFDVVEHVDDVSKLYNGVVSKMDNDSRIYITVPAYNFLWSYADDIAGHFRRYTTNSCVEELDQFGLEVEYSSYFFSFLTIFQFIFRSIPYRLNWFKNKSHNEQIEKSFEDHRKGKLVTNIVLMFFYFERMMIRLGLRFPFGSSLLIVAKKKQLSPKGALNPHESSSQRGEKKH